MKLKGTMLGEQLGRPPGSALIIIMVFVAISLIAFGSMMYWVSTNATITVRNNLFNQAEAAAESADETALAPMIRDFIFQSLNPASSYNTNIPSQSGWPSTFQFVFSDINGTPGRISVDIPPPASSLTPLGVQYTNLKGYQRFCTNTATATTLNQPYTVPATIEEVISFASIPVFQFAIFYNMDLEFNPSHIMSVTGPVHSNNNIYATGISAAEPLTFLNSVEAAQQVYLSRSTNDPTAGGSGTNVIFALANNPVHNAESLAMPIGTNNDPSTVEGILNLPPAGLAAPSAAAYSPTGMVYLYNAVDLIISNNPTGGNSPTNVRVFYENQFAATPISAVLPDMTVVKTNGGVVSTNSYYSFATNVSFYDYRESATVRAIQVDVGKLRTWLTSTSAVGGSQYDTKNTSGGTDKGHKINSVFVYNTAPLNTTNLPAVRLVNGEQLPTAGLTVATPDPLYVMGSYNITTNGVNYATTLGSTTNGASKPAALMADAITILSTNWNDLGYTNGVSYGVRIPADTTINAAALQGIVPSFTDPGGTGHYSGGVENFLRLLEAWNNGPKTLTYNGSMVAMFPSRYATNLWWNSAYYSPPTRQWGFDATFAQGKLPPVSPQTKKILRLSWSFK